MSITLLDDSRQLAGSIGEAGLGVALTQGPLGEQIAVTAVATSSAKLRLISWRISETGNIERLGDSGSQGEVVDLVDVALAPFGYFITAVRNSTGNLRIIAWHLDFTTGNFKKAEEAGTSEGPIREVAITERPDASVVIAVSDGNGNLVLKHWGVDQFGKLQILGDTGMQGPAGGPLDSVTMQGLLVGGRTAGSLRLSKWGVKPNGAMQRLGQASPAMPVGVVSLTTLAEDDRIVTAVCDSMSNRLRLTAWRWSSNFTALTRVCDSGDAAGAVDRVQCHFHGMSGATPEFPLDVGDPIVLTAVRTNRKLLKLIKWRVRQDTIDRLDDFGDHTGTIDRIAQIFALRNDVYLITIRDGDGRLRLVTYQLDDDRQPAVLPDALTLYDQSMFENTVRVVPPARACQRGSIVIHLGQSLGSEGGTAAGLVHRVLLDRSGNFRTSAAATRVTYPFNSEQANGTDNQIIRLDDGTLLALKNGYCWSDLSPVPEWFDSVTMKGGMNPHGRNVIYILRSTDCGHSWRMAIIDSAVIGAGKYGWPQFKEEDGTWWVGGFDRTELYQDPWTKTVWVSGHGDTNYVLDGKSVVNKAAVIFRSDDRGESWSLFAEYPEWSRQPYVLSSTPGWPLLVLMEVGAEPYLFGLKKGASSIDAGHSVVATSANGTITIGRDKGVADVGRNLGSPLCIVRIGETNQIRIAYPSVNAEGRQGYEICNVTLAANGNHRSGRIARVEAINPSEASCTLGSFARDDLTGANDSYVMFTWIEAPPASSPDRDKLLARFKVFSGREGQYVSRALSLAGGVPSPFSRLAIGHYTTSAGFHRGSQAHFLAQWPVKEGIRGNIVSMPT